MAQHDEEKLSAEFRNAEERIAARSDVFKKELGLWDLVLTQILFIVGLGWVGAAAKLGHAHVLLWLTAIALFYIPSAIVVIHLNKLMPLEGGLYQWAKFGFNEFVGFLVAWNLWLYVILLTSEIGLQFATNLSYATGAKWMAGSKWFITAASIFVIATLTLVSILGLGVGKWVHNAGGVMMIIIFAALIALPFLNVAKGTIPAYNPLEISIPAVTLLNLNILGKMGFGALGGFEYMATFAGECRDPVRSINRSVIIAAPIIAVMFILGTSSMLALIPIDEIDLIGPIPQALSIGFQPFGIAVRVVSLAILMVLAMRIAQASVNFSANSRLPMVAGWDKLLPEWFTRLHATRKTPVNSILLVAAITLSMGLAGLVGVGEQEAFQLLQNAAGIFYALTYLVMFAIPLIGLRHANVKFPGWLKMVSLSGFLMTLLYVVLSVFPIINVASRATFALKITGVIFIANMIGIGIFKLAGNRQSSEPALEPESAD
ncbi:MAG: APC family permease [Acidobacteriota bacterium]